MAIGSKRMIEWFSFIFVSIVLLQHIQAVPIPDNLEYSASGYGSGYDGEEENMSSGNAQKRDSIMVGEPLTRRERINLMTESPSSEFVLPHLLLTNQEYDMKEINDVAYATHGDEEKSEEKSPTPLNTFKSDNKISVNEVVVKPTPKPSKLEGKHPSEDSAKQLEKASAEDDNEKQVEDKEASKPADIMDETHIINEKRKFHKNETKQLNTSENFDNSQSGQLLKTEMTSSEKEDKIGGESQNLTNVERKNATNILYRGLSIAEEAKEKSIAKNESQGKTEQNKSHNVAEQPGNARNKENITKDTDDAHNKENVTQDTDNAHNNKNITQDTKNANNNGHIIQDINNQKIASCKGENDIDPQGNIMTAAGSQNKTMVKGTSCKGENEINHQENILTVDGSQNKTIVKGNNATHAQKKNTTTSIDDSQEEKDVGTDDSTEKAKNTDDFSNEWPKEENDNATTVTHKKAPVVEVDDDLNDDEIFGAMDKNQSAPAKELNFISSSYERSKVEGRNHSGDQTFKSNNTNIVKKVKDKHASKHSELEDKRPSENSAKQLSTQESTYHTVKQVEDGDKRMKIKGPPSKQSEMKFKDKSMPKHGVKEMQKKRMPEHGVKKLESKHPTEHGIQEVKDKGPSKLGSKSSLELGVKKVSVKRPSEHSIKKLEDKGLPKHGKHGIKEVQDKHGIKEVQDKHGIKEVQDKHGIKEVQDKRPSKLVVKKLGGKPSSEHGVTKVENKRATEAESHIGVHKTLVIKVDNNECDSPGGETRECENYEKIHVDNLLSKRNKFDNIDNSTKTPIDKKTESTADQNRIEIEDESGDTGSNAPVIDEEAEEDDVDKRSADEDDNGNESPEYSLIMDPYAVDDNLERDGIADQELNDDEEFNYDDEDDDDESDQY